MKRIRDLLILGCCILLLGCNTINGMGRDIEKTGEVIQESSHK